MDKALKVLKVAAYISEVIVASSIVVEMIEKFSSKKKSASTPAPIAVAGDNSNPSNSEE